MVKHLIYLFILVTPLLFSAEFTASVNRSQVYLGEGFNLNLTLKDTSFKNTPSIEALKNDFFIHSQQQLLNSVMMNGKITSSTTWKYTLIPQREGEVTIPSISIETSDGLLSSQPITMHVTKGIQSDGSNLSETKDVVLTTNVSNMNPYKNEPVIYSVNMVSKRDLADIKMQKLDVVDAIVEMHEEPKVYRKVVDGVNVSVIEFSYLITPLKAGSLKIPSVAIQGLIPVSRKNQRASLMDDDFDLFSMIQGFDQLKPFSLATEEVVLDVLPAIPGVNPWLPARSLKIEEIWNDNQLIQQGEPFTRGFKIVAEGLMSSQLPSLNDLQVSDSHFKIYADKPELGDGEKGRGISSSRQEQYTLIPQESGSLTLPEVSISWWDVVKNEKVISTIPSRTLNVLPLPENGQKKKLNTTDELPVVKDSKEIIIQRDPLLYAVIGVLALSLIIAILWGITLQRKIIRMKESSASLRGGIASAKKQGPVKDKKEKLPDLNPT